MTASWVSPSVAVAALILGGFNFWYSAGRPWRRTRWATPIATMELFSYQTETGWRTDDRIVVTNLGDATMRDVTVEVRGDDDQAIVESMALWPRMPIPELHKGQSLPLKSVDFERPKPASIVLRWRDGRRSEQERVVWLTYRRV